MICPKCGNDQLITTNSRPTSKNTQTWRRRQCLKCRFIFTTHETFDLSHLTVIKKNGKKVKYIRAKLYSGIYEAYSSLKKMDRGDAGLLAEKATQDIERDILLSGIIQIKSLQIKKMVQNYLKSHRYGAYLHYLSYFSYSK